MSSITKSAETRNPKITAAAQKAREWLYGGSRCEPGKTMTGSRTSLASKLEEMKTDDPVHSSSPSQPKSPSITSKDQGRKIESPRDQDAPSPKPLSEIQSAVFKVSTPLSRKTRSASTTSLRASSAGASDDWGLVPCNLERSLDNTWGNSFARSLQRQYQDTAFIAAWICDVADAPGVDTAIVKYQDPANIRDIDIYTEDCADWVQYPHTMRNSEVVGEDDAGVSMRWRSDNMTAALHIKQREAVEELRKLENQQAAVMNRALDEARGNKDQEVVEWPVADCLLRPVREGDFEEIAEIVNLEAKEEYPQIIHKDDVAMEHVGEMHRACERAKKPFIVAVSGQSPLLDRSKWPKDSEREYLEYVKFKNAQPPEKKKVLGFAYVENSRTGFLGRTCHGARHSGEIKLLVHPDHRRQRIGMALLDRILRCIDTCHRSLVDHKWQCEPTQSLYEQPPGSNQRPYAWVDIVTLCSRQESDEDLERQNRFVGRYGFEMKERLEEEVRTDRGYESVWLAVVRWRKMIEGREKMPDFA